MGPVVPVLFRLAGRRALFCVSQRQTAAREGQKHGSIELTRAAANIRVLMANGMYMDVCYPSEQAGLDKLRVHKMQRSCHNVQQNCVAL